MAKQGESARASGDEAAGVAPASALPLAELFRQKRREAGLSQQELAERCGVKQSAISGFERHGSAAQALSAEKLRQVADLLGIVVDEARVKARPHAARLVLFYCPDPDCPSTHVYPLGARTAYRPRFVRAEAEVQFHCPDCGEICEKRCPECGTPISERLRGAFCSDCGKPLVAGDRLTTAAIAEREACRAALTAAIPAVEFRHGREGAGAGGD